VNMTRSVAKLLWDGTPCLEGVRDYFGLCVYTLISPDHEKLHNSFRG
jgi:hypothetical protein